MYIDIKDYVDPDCICNMICGGRGIGKTYSAKKYVVNRYLETGGKFITFTRFKTQAKRVDDFFLKIRPEFEDKDLFTDGNRETGYFYYCNDECIGTNIFMSSSARGYEFSGDFVVLFDEFICEPGENYVQSEVTKFSSILESIFRTEKMRIIMLSNSVTVVNPYFMFFDIQEMKSGYYNNGTIKLTVLDTPKEFVENKIQTDIGKLFRETGYFDYSVNNMSLLDKRDYMVTKKLLNQPRSYICSVCNNNVFLSFYNIDSTHILALEDKDKQKRYYGIDSNDLACGYTIIPKMYMSLFKSRIKLGHIYFDSHRGKQVCFNIFL